MKNIIKKEIFEVIVFFLPLFFAAFFATKSQRHEDFFAKFQSFKVSEFQSFKVSEFYF